MWRWTIMMFFPILLTARVATAQSWTPPSESSELARSRKFGNGAYRSNDGSRVHGSARLE